MDYNSIEEILQSGTSNMTLVTAGLDDYGCIIEGVPWFSIYGEPMDIIDATHYSGFYLGTYEDPIAMMRINASYYGMMTHLYREEGTLYDEIEFLKIRWVGYTYYEAPDYPELNFDLEYDVIFWSTGDISIHMVKIPVEGFNPTYYGLEGYNDEDHWCQFGEISEESRNVWLKKTDVWFDSSYNLIEIERPYDKRYLLRANNELYTVLEGNLHKLSNSELVLDTLITHGTKRSSAIIPFIKTLSQQFGSVDIVYWGDSEDEKSKISIGGEPILPKPVYSNIASIPNGNTINKVEIKSSYNDVLVTVSFDNQASWKYYNGSSWVVAETLNEGMTKQVVNSLTGDQWKQVVTSNSFLFRFAYLTVDSYVGAVAVDYEPIN